MSPLLCGTLLVLVGLLAGVALRLKSRAESLKRRAAFEQLITGISRRFGLSSAQNVDVEIDQALAEMAAFIRCDRAYFVMSSPSARLRIWHKPGMEPPPDWPARAPELAIRIGVRPDGVIHVPQARRMPAGEGKAICLALGLGGWACATNVNVEGVRFTLGFDSRRGLRRISQPGELSLLRAALDTIVQALERNAIEQERMRLEAHLQRARRLEKIGLVSSGIAHNFNNILGGILGHSEVLEELVGSDARLARNLAAIQRGAERARDLVEQILFFDRGHAARRRPLDIGAMIAETASLFGASMPAGIDLIVHQPPTTAIVSGEQAQLQQVLLNLCKNAAHAMQSGGHIEVATELHAIAERRLLSHGALRPGRHVCITVTDSGIGMDLATLGRLFEPFFSTRTSGNGLGLVTVLEIVREHEGAIDVQSKIGQGSRFDIWLPLVEEHASVPNDGGLPMGNGETVMLVAQDGMLVLRDEETLAALGYEPVGFTNIDAALAACRNDPERFDIVVVGDCGLAERSLDLATTIHAASPRLPIVLAARAATEIAVDRLVGAGISDIVRWPMMAEEIAAALVYGGAARKLETPSLRRVASATSSSI